MFNNAAIDSTPTFTQISAIIEYIKQNLNYDSDFMMDMERISPKVIFLNFNNAGFGQHATITFNDKNKIDSFG